jgi:hypothetical protein
MQKQTIFITAKHIQIIESCSSSKAYRDYNYLLAEKCQNSKNRVKTRLTLQYYCEYHGLDMNVIQKIIS